MWSSLIISSTGMSYSQTQVDDMWECIDDGSWKTNTENKFVLSHHHQTTFIFTTHPDPFFCLTLFLFLFSLLYLIIMNW